MGIISLSDINNLADATPDLFNSRFDTIVDTINGNIDSTNIADGSITTAELANNSVTQAKLDTTIDPISRAADTIFDHISSGCVWSGDSYASTLNGSMTSGTVYIGGKRVTVSSVTAHAFTASSDTYVYVDNVGAITYTTQSNNTASPSLPSNSILLAIVVSGANIAAATSINQGQENRILPIVSSIPYAVTDSLGNLICPRDPSRKILGYRQILSSFTSAATTQTQVTGLTCPVIVPTGRKVKVSAYTYLLSESTSPKNGYMSIWDGVVGSGTQLQLAQMLTNTNGNGNEITATAVSTPASSSKTYNMGAHSDSGASVGINALSTAPAFILVELL